ncbi:hypothetical protein VTI74DRAFT_4815 [Chaetomium olivicolor]
MTTTYDIAALPSFPTEWTAPASCFATTRYYRVLLGSGYFSNLYGTPTPVLTGIWPTGDCWPPSSTPRIPFVTDGGCPAGYTRACATAGPDYKGKPMSTVTCCPSIANNAFSFMCRDHEYGCHATATSGAVWTGVLTDIGLATPTEEPITHTPNSKEGLEAWGIKLISIAPATTSTGTTDLQPPSITPSSNPNPNPTAGDANEPSNQTQPQTTTGLGTGAIAGIAVGAAAAVALLGLVGFLLYRRSHKRQLAGAGAAATAQPPSTYYPHYTAVPPEQKPVYQLDSEFGPQMLETPDHRGGATPRWEMQG